MALAAATCNQSKLFGWPSRQLSVDAWPVFKALPMALLSMIRRLRADDQDEQYVWWSMTHNMQEHVKKGNLAPNLRQFNLQLQVMIAAIGLCQTPTIFVALQWTWARTTQRWALSNFSKMPSLTLGKQMCICCIVQYPAAYKLVHMCLTSLNVLPSASIMKYQCKACLKLGIEIFITKPLHGVLACC